MNGSIVFIDLETTGLDPEYHEIIDIAIVITDNKLDEITSFRRLVMPKYPDRISKRAQEINGFDEKEWKCNKAINQSTLANELTDFFSYYALNKIYLVPAGHRVQFDTGFLEMLTDRFNLNPFPIDNRRFIDSLVVEHIVTISKAIKYSDASSRYLSPSSFDKLAKSYNIERAGKHDAETDIRDTIKIIKQQILMLASS